MDSNGNCKCGVSIAGRFDQKQRTVDRFMDLQKVLTLDSELSRIECYDISHTAGEGAVGSCVVFDESGSKKI